MTFQDVGDCKKATLTAGCWLMTSGDVEDDAEEECRVGANVLKGVNGRIQEACVSCQACIEAEMNGQASSEDSCSA